VIEVADQEGVAILHMADGKANAMSLEFCETLTAHFTDVSTARAVVLTGTGRNFPPASISSGCSMVARPISADSCRHCARCSARCSPIPSR
jgi:hypothetical protein